MARDLREIYELYLLRQQQQSPMHQAARNVSQAYYGEIVLPLPEMDRSERSLVANLLYTGGEQKSMRLASTMPDVQYPSMDPGKPRADKRAQERRLVNKSWWDDELYSLKLRKRARHMVFYAATPVVLRPDFANKRPSWQVRNPLMTFAPQLDVGELQPTDVIFTYTKSLAWLQKNYPSQTARLNKNETATNYVCLEYIDSDEYVTAVIGDKHTELTRSSYAQDNVPLTSSPDGEIVELHRTKNLIGEVPAVCAGRIGLESARGELDGVVGLFQAQAKMMALQVLGVQRGVFPEMWLVDHPNGEGAQVIREADPMHGITGHVKGGTLEQIHVTPEAINTQLIGQFERSIRIDGGIPAELGGESTSNVRTGKRGDSILSAVLDFPIQEEQQLLEASMRVENQIAQAIDKAYFPTAKHIYLSGTAGLIEYQATELWEDPNRANWVKFPMTGVDAQSLPVVLGQRVGTGMMSKQTAMEMDPYIEDPIAEFDRINNETLRAGLIASLGTMASDPTMAPKIARMMVALRANQVQPEDAVLRINEEIQKEQEEAAQAAQQGAMPPTGAQPGLGAPPSIGPPTPSAANLTALLGGLHAQSNAAV